MPQNLFSNLAAHIIVAASESPAPKNSKGKNKENPSEKPNNKESANPSETPTDSTGGDSDPFSAILDFILAYPWIPGIVIAIVGVNIGWRKLTERQNLNGQPLSPLGEIIRRTLRLIFKEDKTPVFMRPQKFAMKMRWLTWQRYWFIAVGALLFDISAFSGIIPDQYEIVFTAIIIIMILAAVKHIRLIFQRRHRILMQMFEVAAAECKYPKGSELNPWGWVQITKWNGLYSPAGTYVVFPPRIRSEDERFQQGFERNFASTVSSEHTWMYTWESANNRVLCEPVPFITDNAPYPFPDEHPWNEFPLGLAAGGEEAVWDVSVFPHSLVAGTTGSGKASDNRTLIPVPVSDKHPSGWTTFGEVEVGDTLFDEHGQPCRVTGLSEIRDDFDMYRVSFSDGTYIDASGDHMWFTETRQTRESRWNARRKKVERRSLVSESGRTMLEDLLATQTDSSEVTIRQVAEAAGVHETSPWLLEIAAHLGPVGEVQAVVDFHYAEQQVLQKQKMAVYDAQAAWGALARYRDEAKVPAWYAQRDKCAELASKASDIDTITSRDVGRVLGMTPKKAGAMLRQKGLESWAAKAGPGRAVAMFPARATWKTLAESQPIGDASPWKRQRALFEQRLTVSQPGEEVTASEIAADIGVSAADVRGILKRLGVPCVVEKREVLLQVPEKVVRRKTVPARTYLGRKFLRLVLERIETPAHDQRHKRDLGTVRTTLDILATLKTDNGLANHSIPVSGPLEMPPANLTISPYLLGVWLGDGFSRSGAYAGIDREMAGFLRAEGEKIKEYRHKNHDKTGMHPDFREWKVAGLTQALRAAGLLQRTTSEGSRKHIPAIYLRSSIAQRRALLAGLLDTDGTVAPQGTVNFDNTNKELAYQTLELARSLGYRATIIEKRVTLNGEDYGLVYRVAFTCAESPFRLTRKTEEFIKRTAKHNPEKTSHRYITDIQRIPAVPGRCIMVDSPSRLFLAGDAMIPTHNSVTQRTILLHALQSPDWRVSLIDPKRVELSAYTRHPNVVKVETELEDSVALLEGVEKEMQSRYKRMEKEGVNHFKRLSTAPPAMLLMVDELFALLSPENIKSDEGKERDELHARATVIIGSIARLGRAAGIHMILATQRPDAKVLPGETKALALDTPILTPEGWSTVEKLQPGDEVFAPDGTATLVTGVTDVMHNHECYEVEFSDGSTIVADAGHLWVTEDAIWRSRQSRARKRAKARGDRPLTKREEFWAREIQRAPEPVTTQHIFESVKYHGKSNHSIPVTSPLVFPEAELPVDPYVLGVWLGDGSTGTTNVTGVDLEIFDHVRDAGYSVWRNKEARDQLWRFSESDERAHRWKPGLKGSLRDLGVLYSKHIPDIYLKASAAQRLSLLQGLMDTDGTVCQRERRSRQGTAPAGQVLLCLTNRELLYDAYDLAVGLGFQPTVTEEVASYTLNGVRKVTGPVWILRFTPHSPVFRLSRKRAAQALSGSAPRGTTERRYITAVRPVASVPVKCIAVEHPSRQFLAGRSLIATHNSNLDCRIAQGRMDTTPSLMVLDSEAATRIPKIKGRAMVRQGGETTEFQAYFLPEDSLSMVLEMSEALATEQMTVQDFKDLIEQAREGDGGGGGGRFKLPKIPIPKGLASRLSSWVARRKEVVERNESEGKRFASRKSSPPMTDASSSVSSVGAESEGRRGLRGRRGRRAPEELGAVQRVPEAPQEASEEFLGGVEDFGAPGEHRGPGEPRGGAVGALEVPHGRARGEGFDDFDEDYASFEGEDDDEDDYDPAGVDLQDISFGDDEEEEESGSPDLLGGEQEFVASGVVEAAYDEDDDDDFDFEGVDFSASRGEDFVPSVDLDSEDFLEDILDEQEGEERRPVATKPPVEPPLPQVPPRRPESEDPRLSAPSRPVPPPLPPVAAAPPVAAVAEPVPPAADLNDELREDEEDIFSAVTEAPWMPDAVSGSTSGPSPFGGGEFAPPPTAQASPPSANEPSAFPGAGNIDDDDEPFI